VSRHRAAELNATSRTDLPMNKVRRLDPKVT
jgi:hypothetical protein